jgi:nitric oxide reductase NorE protein
MHYSVMTGVHVAHILIGLTFLTVVRRELREAQTPRMALVEAGGIYWHMVDFLWFMIFSLLYLMR